jgi:hypothetical protein
MAVIGQDVAAKATVREMLRSFLPKLVAMDLPESSMSDLERVAQSGDEQWESSETSLS